MTTKGITTIKFGNGTIVTPDMQHFSALNWAKEECKRLNTWWTYTIKFS